VILAGDIGGTRARLMLVSPTGKKVARQAVYESRAYESLEAVVKEFLGRRPPKVTAACFGVAGPVVAGKCTATNLPWVVDARLLARKLKIRRVSLINDLVALGLGALTVGPQKLKVLQGDGPPKKKGANLAIIAAGTGLGEAALVWDGLRFIPLASEGGHSDFAPRDDLECELLGFLRARLRGRVSYERCLSGPGLGNLYDFFRGHKNVKESKRNAEAIKEAKDRNAEIAKLGMSGESDAASRAIDLFVSLYGAEAGNLGLKTMSIGGVFVAGNIARFLLKRIENGAFLKSFNTKGRFSSLMEKMPVTVVLDSDIGLAGSAYFALHPAG
jgi:glucokinase